MFQQVSWLLARVSALNFFFFSLLIIACLQRKYKLVSHFFFLMAISKPLMKQKKRKKKRKIWQYVGGYDMSNGQIKKKKGKLPTHTLSLKLTAFRVVVE